VAVFRPRSRVHPGLDGSDRIPVLRDAQPEAESGRGLLLVDSLSEDWGSYRQARLSGKVVWSVIALSMLAR
jgi:hypothetical protein